MKIEFIKEYCACFRDENGSINTETFKRGDTVSTSMEADRYFTEELAQWLIKNGFAEEVKESGWWKPRFDETYYFVDGSGKVCIEPWLNDELDEYRYSVGECFKTEKAAEAWRDYRMARATVSRDEGFMKGTAYDGVYSIFMGETLRVDDYPVRVYANTLYFDTREHAIASLQNHTKEWEVITSYDWSLE